MSWIPGQLGGIDGLESTVKEAGTSGAAIE
jgi:hypothetical protein